MTMFSRMKDKVISSISSPQKLEVEEHDAVDMERFRQAMLELAGTVPGDRSARLALRIRCAATLQSLWFMRSDMMALLAPALGEAEARHRLEVISAQVREALPAALRSRPSPLDRPH
jgi:hypothetical protein